MPSPNKNCMLCDVQYVKQNRQTKTPDYLYVIWRDMITQEKFMQAIPEPLIDIYFEKPEFRNHRHNKNYARIEELDKRTVKYKDIINAIAEDGGDAGKRYLSEMYLTRNYQGIQNMYMYPYVYGADYDVTAWYRIQWLRTLDNDLPKKLHKGFLDIEVDGFEVPGMPIASICPINAVTIIDEWNKTVYTFLLTDTPCNSDDPKKRAMYQNMWDAQHYMMDHQDEFIQELHELFDESYGVLEYKQYFYSDERKMLTHIFQLINELKMDFIGIWNISFDIPYIMDRMISLGMDPKEVMSHPDFPVKKCYFKEDKINFDIKNKSDIFMLTSYTVFYDQMEMYASIRKGASELRSYKLNTIANNELKDSKLDYSEDGDIKTLPYTNYKLFVIYNIKDVLLQMGIERKTSDFDTLYVSSYKNATPYDKVFKQTVKLRNVQYLSFLDQGLIPGENINIYNKEDPVKKTSDDDDDDEEEFEGALVADPMYNDNTGVELYGKPSNNIHNNSIDMDMSAFYPNCIQGMNIDASTLIFKCIMPAAQFDMFGGDMALHGITHKFFSKEDDAAKECFDNFQTGNYLTTATKWLNLPDIAQVHQIMKKRMKRR